MAGAWITESIGGKPADVLDGATPNSPRFGLLYLHGGSLETLRGRPVYSRRLEELALACVCPHGGRCWWVDRPCTEFDSAISPEQFLLQSVLPFFEERLGLRPPAIGLLGVSMGGQGALRLAFKHPQLFPVVAAIAPAIEYHELYGRGTVLDAMYTSKEQCRQDTAPMHVPPAGYPPHVFFCVDPADAFWFRGNDRLHEKLSALGIPHEIDFETEAGSHSWEYFDHMAGRALDFLCDGLVRESRRLL
jgi:S-formylglutathione hydrolase